MPTSIDVDRDKALRAHLRKLLDWQDAHVNFDVATDGIAPAFRGAVPAGLPYSLWQLIEHMRRAQRDILEFCRNPDYVEPLAADYWPRFAGPSTDGDWEQSIVAFCLDREELKKLAADDAVDLFDRIPHGTGQTYLRELLLVADHNAYHVGQLVAVRRCLGIWESP